MNANIFPRVGFIPAQRPVVNVVRVLTTVDRNIDQLLLRELGVDRAAFGGPDSLKRFYGYSLLYSHRWHEMGISEYAGAMAFTLANARGIYGDWKIIPSSVHLRPSDPLNTTSVYPKVTALDVAVQTVRDLIARYPDIMAMEPSIR